jgi:hypothetical protein
MIRVVEEMGIEILGLKCGAQKSTGGNPWASRALYLRGYGGFQ